MGRIERNAEAVEKFLELHSGYIGPGSPPDEPLTRAKGSSRAPASKALIGFLEANIEASRYIGWRVAELRRHDIGYGGIAFSEVLTHLYGEPAIIRRWRAEETNHEKAYLRAFRKLCHLVATSIAASNPDVTLSVATRPRDEPLRVEGAPHHRKRRLGVEDSYRARYERLRRIEESQDCTRTAAVAMLSEEIGVGAATIWRAISFVEKQAS